MVRLIFYARTKTKAEIEAGPMTEEHWSDLRSYEPGLTTSTYEKYVEQFNKRKSIGEDVMYMAQQLAIDTNNPDLPEKLKQLEDSDEFKCWLGYDSVELANKIINRKEIIL